ncbi:MAG: hypothetical protein MZV63_45350 [Marinilabiliales bacterium]|nr:hypothetical protein [Marinilabiliales bacterium]
MRNKTTATSGGSENPYVISNNGNDRIDEYFWMRLTDEQKNAETPDSQTVKVLNYLNAENDYAKAIMKHTEAFQQQLFEEIKGRIKENDETVPYLDNGYYYQTKYYREKNTRSTTDGKTDLPNRCLPPRCECTGRRPQIYRRRRTVSLS